MSTIQPITSTTTAYPPPHRQPRPLTYSTPLASVVPLDECYESPLWATVHEAREEMKAARDSGQSTDGIIVDWFMCAICTCMIGPEFCAKDLYMYPVYAQHMHIADFGHKEPWEPWEGDDGDNLYWEPDKVRIVFDVLHVCGSCARNKELDESLLVIAGSDWPALLSMQLPLTTRELMYPVTLHEGIRLGKVRTEIKKRVEQRSLYHYRVLYIYLLNYFIRVGYMTQQATKALGLITAMTKPHPIIPLEEHRQRKREQQSAQVYYSPIQLSPHYQQSHSAGAIAVAH